MSELDKIGLPPDVVNELCNINDSVVLRKRIQQLEQDNEALKASLSLCQEQNKEMLDMLKQLSRIFDSEYESVNIFKADAVRDLVTKIESRNKEGEK